jgi:hypothetical protein
MLWISGHRLGHELLRTGAGDARSITGSACLIEVYPISRYGRSDYGSEGCSALSVAPGHLPPPRGHRDADLAGEDGQRDLNFLLDPEHRRS